MRKTQTGKLNYRLFTKSLAQQGNILTRMLDWRDETALCLDPEGKSHDFSNAQWFSNLHSW